MTYKQHNQGVNMSIHKTGIYFSLILGSVFASSAFGADYNDFVTPSSLGKAVSTLNSQYKLGLKKQDGGYYRNSKAYNCGLFVRVNDNNKISHIEISPNNSNCHYKVSSSGISFKNNTTKVVDVLNQVRLEDIKFIPGCFNCPSRIEISDSLIINRPQDKYYTELNIEGYNTDYQKFMAQKIFGNFNEEEFYSHSIELKLEEKLANNPGLYNRKDFKLKAIQTYNLQYKPWSYTIALK